MTVTRELIGMTSRIARLPVDERGYPVPKFVHFFEGKPDFRVVTPGWLQHCVNHRACWICGEKLGKFLAFVIGPMCGLNRISSEPPSHLDCAVFAIKNCPFLSRPLAKRNERDLPDGRHVAGKSIAHNPEVTLLWMTLSYQLFPVDNGMLVRIGPPEALEFFSQGRKATRREVERSVDKGFPLLIEAAESPEEVLNTHRARHVFDKMIHEMFDGQPA